MKPSKRIAEIQEKLRSENGGVWVGINDAIIQYLDEEWEKNHPCEHLHTEPFGPSGIEVCQDCKRLGHFKDQ